MFSYWVNGDGELKPADASSHWVGLCGYNDEVWKLFWSIFRQKPDANDFLNLWYARPEVAQDAPVARGDG